MINALQIITHVPLFTLWFPANASYMFSIMISISNFDILPAGISDKILSVFGSSEALNTQFDSLDIF